MSYKTKKESRWYLYEQMVDSKESLLNMLWNQQYNK